MPAARSLRARVHAALDPRARPQDGLSALDHALIVLIVFAVIAAVAETEPTVLRGHEGLFAALNLAIGAIFAVEYLARLWSAAERDPARPWSERLRFATSFAGLIDLVTIVSTLDPLLGFNAAPLRIVRAMRIVRLARLGRMSAAIHHLHDAIVSRRYELLLSSFLALVLLLFGATSLYWLEGAIQPDKFGSIPRAMWWAVETLTTLGYGDVYPVTPGGKLIATVMAILGIGVIALPTGILASAFSDAVQRQREAERERERMDG